MKNRVKSGFFEVINSSATSMCSITVFFKLFLGVKMTP